MNVTLKSRYKQEEFIDGYWALNIVKKNSIIYFYPGNETWRENHSDARGDMEQLKNKKEIGQGFCKVSIGHLRDCLLKRLPHFREMPSKYLGRLAKEMSTGWERHGSSLEKSDGFPVWTGAMVHNGSLEAWVSGALVVFLSAEPVKTTRISLSHIITQCFSFPINRWHRLYMAW